MARSLILSLALLVCLGIPARADHFADQAEAARCARLLSRINRGWKTDDPDERDRLLQPIGLRGRASADRAVRQPPLDLQSIPEVLGIYSPLVKEPLRTFESLDELRMGTFNVLKFLAYGPRPEAEEKPKTLGSAIGVAQAILKNNLDIVVLQEVEGLKALQQLNYHFLGDRYDTYLIPGNDAWGMNIGFLVRKNLPFAVEQKTHQAEAWRDPARRHEWRRLFTRDLPSLTFRVKGRQVPLFVLIGTHLKSQGPRSDIDPDSSILRSVQAGRSAVIAIDYLREFGQDTPLAISGDLNGSVIGNRALHPLFRNDLFVDAFDVMNRGLTERDRATHSWLPADGRRIYEQLDGTLLTQAFRPYLRDVYVYRWPGPNGLPLPLPETAEERDQLPSDHFLLVTRFDFARLRADWLRRPGR